MEARPGVLLATHFSHEKRVFGKTGAVFKIFFSFPSDFLWLFTFSINCSYPNTPCHSLQTPLLHLFTSKNSKKRYGLLFFHLISLILIFIFVSICVGVFDFCYGFVSVFLGLFLFGLFKVLFPCKLISVDGFIYVLVFVFLRLSDCLICVWCTITCWFPLSILLEPNSCGSFVFSIFSFVVNLVWCLYLLCD